MSLFEELKRRNVFRVAIAYVVTGWLLLQVADVVLGNIGAPSWVFKAILLLIGLCFPLALILAWAFELTPDGLRKEKDVERNESITHLTGRKLDFAIILLLAAGLGYFAIDKFVTGAPETAPISAAAPTDAAPEQQSIAVLPFVNMSSDPEQEYFSDGVSEELLNVLAQYPTLRVAARTSSFQFKGRNQDIGAIAELLKVEHVLEGSVRKSGNRVRITAQLIKAEDGFHLWSETYDREMDDIFAIQDEIANAIGDELRVRLALSGDAPQPTVLAAANTAAYDAFLRGRGLIHQRGRNPLEQAVDELERSLRLDANYAPAHAQLAIAYLLLIDSPSSYGDLTMAEAHRRAVPHIERARELAPNHADVHAAQALLKLHDDPRGTIEHAGRALELNPSHIDALVWMSIAYQDMDDHVASAATLDRILDIDPLTVVGRLNRTVRLIRDNRMAEAHEVAESLVAQNPWAGYTMHAEAALLSGNVAESLRWSLLAYSENPRDGLSNFYLVIGLLLIGQHDEARRISDNLLYIVDTFDGDYEAAVARVQRRVEIDPDNVESLEELADTLYSSHRFEESRDAYEKLVDRAPEGLSILSFGNALQFAVARRETGDTLGAQAVIEYAEETFDKLLAAGFDNIWRYINEARFHLYHGRDEQAIRSMQVAVERGLRGIIWRDDPLFEPVLDDPRVAALVAEIERLAAIERENSLELLCFGNPVPEAWQPLPETCAGLETTRASTASRHVPAAGNID